MIVLDPLGTFHRSFRMQLVHGQVPMGTHCAHKEPTRRCPSYRPLLLAGAVWKPLSAHYVAPQLAEGLGQFCRPLAMLIAMVYLKYTVMQGERCPLLRDRR